MADFFGGSGGAGGAGSYGGGGGGAGGTESTFIVVWYPADYYNGTTTVGLQKNQFGNIVNRIEFEIVPKSPAIEQVDPLAPNRFGNLEFDGSTTIVAPAAHYRKIDFD